jgi:hypothetical protein
MSALTDAEFHRFGRGMWRMPISAFRGTGTVIIVGERGNASLVGADTLTVGPGEIVLVPSGRYEYASVGSQAAIAVATLPAIATELPVATPYLRITPTGGTAASVLRYVVLGLTSDSSSGESPRSPRVGQQLSAIVAATYAEHLSTPPVPFSKKPASTSSRGCPTANSGSTPSPGRSTSRPEPSTAPSERRASPSGSGSASVVSTSAGSTSRTRACRMSR